MTLGWRRPRGQGMTEYIIIVALIAIAAIAVLMYYGNDLRHLFSASSNGIAGMEEAESGAQKVDQHQATAKKNLKIFGGNRLKWKP